MSTITEQPIWENSIYLIDENDPVQGGATGISNKAPNQLANRTAYLKAEQESTAKKLNNTIGGADDEVTLASLLEMIKGLQTELANRKPPYIPIGWIMDTTVHYTSAVDVAKAMGYGTWIRFGEGCVSVGYSTDNDDPDWTRNMGQEYGEYEHRLTVDEMPEHKHPIKLSYENSLAKDAFIDGEGFVPLDLTGPFGVHDSFEEDHSYSKSDGTGNPLGSNGKSLPHNNVQRSIVVGRWLRTA